MSNSRIPRLNAILLLLILIAVLPGVLLTAVAAITEHKENRDRVARDLLTVARFVATEQETLVESAHQTLTVLASTPQVQAGGIPCSELLADMLPHYPQYVNLGVVSTDGRILCSARGMPSTVHDAHEAVRICVQRVLQSGTFSISGYTIDPVTGRPIIAFGQPVFDRAGLALGVVFVTLDLRWLNRFIGSTDLPPRSVVILADSTGVVLARYPNPDSWVGRRLPLSPFLRNALRQDRMGVTEIERIDDQTWLYAFTVLSPPDRLHEFVAVGVPRSLAFADARRALFRGLAMLLVILGIGGASALVIGRVLLLQPIQALVSATRRIEAGERGVHSGVHRGSREIVGLASTFDHMAATLESREREVMRASEAQRFLAEAGAALSSSLDYQETLRTVSQLAIPVLADWCTIDVRSDNAIERVAAAHRDPAREAALQGEPAPRPDAPAVHAFRSGQTWLGTMPRGGPHRTEGLPSPGAVTPDNVIAVPLIARGQTLGAVTLGREYTGYSADDIVLAEDLAKRMATAIDNARLYDAQVLASRAKSDFLAIASHELRTPLTAIMGYADLLSAGIGGQLSQQQQQSTERILSNARKLGGMVDEILSYASLEAGREAVRREPIDLREFIEVLAATIRPLISRKNLSFNVKLPDEPVTVEIDRAKIRHILVDLLSNAVNFTDRGEITLEARVENENLIVDVRDTGIGIAEADLGRVFEPFWQVEPATTRRIGGVGLGLSVARRIARLLGGDITVRSRVGEGSVFTVTIPLNGRGVGEV